MASQGRIYTEVPIEDMEQDKEEQMFYYSCPCGDKFEISLEELYEGEDIAHCPSCSLQIKVIFKVENLPPLEDEVPLTQSKENPLDKPIEIVEN
mmetsp:Transcript_27150/g.35597  ORF Transcript_27150/g.35597 Transcript_27150/m.35597 type:complete len:94 (-) Transcript_27150:239-520(-)